MWGDGGGMWGDRGGTRRLEWEGRGGKTEGTPKDEGEINRGPEGMVGNRGTPRDGRELGEPKEWRGLRGSQRTEGGIERGKRGSQRMEGKEGILKDGWEVIEDPKG